MYTEWDNPRTEIFPWLLPLMNSVDSVYSNGTLKSFWRSSTLVVNDARLHPYQSNIPPEYANVDRMFLLDTSLNPPDPWTLNTKFSVMALARVQGESPFRQWLVYAYAPLGAKSNVQITIPNYGDITVDIKLEGSFYLIDENTRSIIPLGN